MWNKPSYWNEENVFCKLLRDCLDDVELKIDNSKQPNIVFASVFIKENIEDYKNCVKILYVGENPDRYIKGDIIKYYNKFDVVFSYEKKIDKSKLTCKHVRFPNWIILTLVEKIINIFDKKNRNITEEEFNNYLYKYYKINKNKKGVIICSHDRNGTREKICEMVSKFMKIHYAGKWRNNVKKCGNGWMSKINYLHKYTFNICPENSIYDGYHTEKLFDALITGCIPIYWGSSIENEYFNENKIIRNQNQLKNCLENINVFLKKPPFTKQFFKLVLDKRDEVINILNSVIEKDGVNLVQKNNVIKEKNVKTHEKNILSEMTNYFDNTLFFKKKYNNIERYSCIYLGKNKEVFNYLLKKKNMANFDLFVSDRNGKFVNIPMINNRNIKILMKPKYHNKTYINRTISLVELSDKRYNLGFGQIDIVAVDNSDNIDKLLNSVIIVLDKVDVMLNNYDIVMKSGITVFQKRNKIQYPLYNKTKLKPMIIMGNGPSLKDLIKLDLHKVSEKYDTFGLNAAYRFFETKNWFPTYFGSFDSKVTPHHTNDIIDYIKRSNGKTKKFLSIKEFLAKNVKKCNFLDARDCHRCFNPNWWYSNTGSACSGHTALKFAIQEGYKIIYLIGVDANYIDFVEGSKKSKNNGLVIKKTPEKNPNYFDDKYQLKGDKYNIPRAGGHINSWYEAYVNCEFNKNLGIEIYNSSKISKVKYFKFKDITV